MATALTETVNSIRRIIIIAGLLLLAYFLFTFALDFLKGLTPLGKGPTAPRADVRFGKLPTPALKNLIASPKAETAVYTLETVNARFPDFPALLPVFPVQTPGKSILAAERAKEIAALLGFTGQPTFVSPIDYLWEKPAQGIELRMNIITLNYRITTRQILPLAAGLLPGEDHLKNTAQNFFGLARPLDKSFAENKTGIEWLRFNGQTYSKAESLSEAEAARIDFFRTVKIGGISYLLRTVPPQESLVSAYFKGGQKDPYEINFTIWPYNFEQGATYPLKNVSLAWEELKKGQGAVVSLSSRDINYSKLPQRPEINTVTLRDIQLAYFDEAARQNFLQPIYVFSGQAELKNGESAEIIIYVPAVDEKWIVK